MKVKRTNMDLNYFGGKMSGHTYTFSEGSISLHQLGFKIYKAKSLEHGKFVKLILTTIPPYQSENFIDDRPMICPSYFDIGLLENLYYTK